MSRRRRHTASVVGEERYLLRCPHCRAFRWLIVPAFADDRGPWETRPALDCSGCANISATTAWALALYEFRPLDLRPMTPSQEVDHA